jgi:hypothetical protein
MHVDTVVKLLIDCYKNRFEICADNNGISLDEFEKRSFSEQVSLICAEMRSEYHHYGVRRVILSNRCENGIRLYYLALNMGVSAGRNKYGPCCVTFNTSSDESYTALMYDSLTHYYDEDNQFNESLFRKDLLPYQMTHLLLLSRYKDILLLHTKDELTQIMETDTDSLEIMTTIKISKEQIKEVVISKEDYKHIAIELNKKMINKSITTADKEKYRSFSIMQKELKRLDIKLRVV